MEEYYDSAYEKLASLSFRHIHTKCFSLEDHRRQGWPLREVNIDSIAGGLVPSLSYEERWDIFKGVRKDCWFQFCIVCVIIVILIKMVQPVEFSNKWGSTKGFSAAKYTTSHNLHQSAK